MMRSYHASNRMPFGSFLLLIIVSGVSAVVLGLALWEIANLMQFLAIVVVIIAGALLGGILTLVVRLGKVRSPIIAGLVGLLAGILLYGVYQFAGYYITFRDDARAIYAENAGKPPTDAQLDHELDLILQDEVGQGGFIGYLLLNAKIGITLTSSPTSSTDSGTELTDTGVWIYWGAELLLVAGFAAWLASREARQPFDEEAKAWYGKPTLLATTSTKSRKELVNALKDGDFQTAGRLLSTPQEKFPRLEVTLRQSPSADNSYVQQDIFLTVNHVQRKGRASAIRSGVISPSEFKLMQMAMSQSPVRTSSPSGTGTVSTAF